MFFEGGGGGYFVCSDGVLCHHRDKHIDKTVVAHVEGDSQMCRAEDEVGGIPVEIPPIDYRCTLE